MKYIVIGLLVFILVFSVSCRKKYIPKQKAYFRIDFPEKKYRHYESDCPFKFDYPVYSEIMKDDDPDAEPCWLNMVFPGYKAIVHLSYKKINGNLTNYTEDAHKFAYRHSVKADAINEIFIDRKDAGVYGMYYDIKGNTASSVQFYLTDSSSNFLRGALYFSVAPNKDSLAPVIDFIKKDIDNMISSFRWK